jgi:predicted GTPase
VSHALFQFVDIVTGQDGHAIGHQLVSQTSDIRAIEVLHPVTGEPVVFVDTPGFDDTCKSDTEVMEMITDWLVKT